MTNGPDGTDHLQGYAVPKDTHPGEQTNLAKIPISRVGNNKMENRHSEAHGQPADVVIRRPEKAATGQGPISINQSGNIESRGLDGTGQGPRRREATGQGPITVTHDGNSESRGLNGTGQGPKKHEATGQGPISVTQGGNIESRGLLIGTGQGPKRHEANGQGPTSVTQGGNSESRGLDGTGQGPRRHEATGQGPISINQSGNIESRGLIGIGQGPKKHEDTGQGPITVTQDGNSESRGLNGIGQGPKGHEAKGQGPITVTQDGNSESRGLNGIGQGPKGHEAKGQGPISVTQDGNSESRGLNGIGQGPKGHEAKGQGPISVTQGGNSESGGLNSTGQGPKGQEVTGQGPISVIQDGNVESEGRNRIGQGPKDGVEQPVTTATESKDDCRDTHKVTGQGPSSITLGGNSEFRGLFIAGQGPASTTNEGDLVVSDESDETTVAIDWVKSRVLNTVAVERDDGIKRPHSGQITLLKEVPTWKERCLGEALEWHGGLAEKISLWRGDITALQVDVVVNAAKSSLLGGGGVDGAIHRVAGPGLRDECATLNGCSVGEAKITGAHGLPAKHVIHTVGPRSGDEELIHCYQSCFSICEERNLQTIAFPCISTGHFGFPKERAAHLAVGTVKEILATGSPNIERVIFCVFTADDVEIYERVLHEYFPVDPVSEGEPVARRGVPYISGVYIEGMVQGIEANFTVDTGATITMMSRDVYERIPENQ